MNWLEQTTAIIKTFQRPDCLHRLVRSIRRYYPRLAILVGDDGPIASPCSGVRTIRLPIDIGVSAGRNALLDEVETPYFLLCDDDIQFRPQSNIAKLARLVAEDRLDIAAGDCLRVKRRWGFLRRKPQPFHGLFDFQPNELRLVHGRRGRGPGYELCDIVHNFYVARTAAVRSIGGWDNELRQNDHVEFFVRAHHAGLRVGYCSDVVAWHWMARPPGYAAYRNRSFHHVAARKIGVERIVGFDGRPFHVDGPTTDRPPRRSLFFQRLGSRCSQRSSVGK